LPDFRILPRKRRPKAKPVAASGCIVAAVGAQAPQART
jgi:hypothetical protein